MISGLLVIDKKKGVSSSQVVVKIKKLLNIKKVGHMGTLDPLATGVLLVGVNKATRLFDVFLTKKKTYIAQFKFGEETETLDLEGKIVKTSENIPTIKQICNVLPQFLGKQSQLPPKYSSKKINGRKACDLVRSGKDVELKPSEIEIFEFKFLEQIDDKTFSFEIECSAGTYIRSIARDLGKLLNSCATMVNLRRIKAGNFDISKAFDIEKETSETLNKKILPLEEVLKEYEKVELNEETLVDLLNGKTINASKRNILSIENKELSFDKTYCLYYNEKVVGLSIIGENNNLKITTFLFDN